MYLKLAIRNAGRSISDYLLYLFSRTILLVILCLSIHLANWGTVREGFHTMALPLLIMLIMVLLVHYINTFIFRQRAKEFATYLLLGMEKNKLSSAFVYELSIMGMVCFLLGAALGTGIFFIYCRIMPHDAEPPFLSEILGKGLIQTFAYFICSEALTIFFVKKKIHKLQIVQLISEKHRTQPLGAGKRNVWGFMLILSFFGYLALLSFICFQTEKIMTVPISLISLPVILCVFSFYKWLYAFMASIRLSLSDTLYQGSRLYEIAEMTTTSITGAYINTVFCLCLIISATSFVFGILLFHPDFPVFEQAQQQWMGFLQISICIIFMVIYFSILSLLHILDFKKEEKNIRILSYLGKNQSELNSLLCRKILVKLFLPTAMSFAVLLPATLFINYKLNFFFPVSMRSIILKAMAGFILCFFALYLCYFHIIYFTAIGHMKHCAIHTFPRHDTH